jgi:hypothetical protein
MPVYLLATKAITAATARALINCFILLVKEFKA